MSIRRTFLAFEEQYTQVPNQWVRDKRLTRKARGLLVELMSHRVGWDITIEHLVANGEEGRDAVRSAIQELESFGYLRRQRERREDGTLGSSDYEIVDPWAGEPTSDDPTLDDRPTKKTIPQEDHLPEPPVVPQDDGFDALWKAWPKKAKKEDAIRAWRRLPSTMKHEAIPHLVAHANAYRQHTPPQFIPGLAPFLNGKRWHEDLAVSRERGAYKPEPHTPTQHVIPQGHIPLRDENGQIIGSRPA